MLLALLFGQEDTMDLASHSVDAIKIRRINNDYWCSKGN